MLTHTPLGEAWKLTPRQLHWILFIVDKIKKAEHRTLLELHALAARGDPKEVTRRLKEDPDR